MTAGPTFEPFDPVRGITNGSSGRQAAAIAAAAVRAGAEVTIVSGPVAVPYPDKAAVIPVQQAQEMFEAVKKELAEHARCLYRRRCGRRLAPRRIFREQT